MKNLLAKSIALFALAAANVASAPAFAADMPAKATYSTPVPVASSWTGFYAGGNVGYGWQDPTVTFAGNDPNTICVFSGCLAGGTPVGPASYNLKRCDRHGIRAGYNWQVDPRWVVGLETDFNGSGIRGGGNNVSNLSTGTLQTITASQNIKWFGTLRGRLGWLATNTLMLYGTGGFNNAEGRRKCDLREF